MFEWSCWYRTGVGGCSWRASRPGGTGRGCRLMNKQLLKPRSACCGGCAWTPPWAFTRRPPRASQASRPPSCTCRCACMCECTVTLVSEVVAVQKMWLYRFIPSKRLTAQRREHYIARSRAICVSRARHAGFLVSNSPLLGVAQPVAVPCSRQRQRVLRRCTATSLRQAACSCNADKVGH